MISLTFPEIHYLLTLMGHGEGSIIRPGEFTGQDAIALKDRLVETARNLPAPLPVKP